MTFTPTFFFTADEHYGHANIIRYCNRPFTSVDQMDAEIIQRHNEIVGLKDVVIHAGDFTLSKKPPAENYIRQLNGTHIFLKGSHDYWLKKSATVIWEKEIEGFYVVVEECFSELIAKLKYAEIPIRCLNISLIPNFDKIMLDRKPSINHILI
jgi:calcineurin-like phosphoesterase family protein